MPYISIKTTQTLTNENKIALTKKLRAAWASVSLPDVSQTIQFTIEEGVFSDFRGDCDGPSAIVQIRLAPITPEEHYEKIVKALFPLLIEYLQTPADKINIAIDVVNRWGFNNGYAKI